MSCVIFQVIIPLNYINSDFMLIYFVGCKLTLAWFFHCTLNFILGVAIPFLVYSKVYIYILRITGSYIDGYWNISGCKIFIWVQLFIIFNIRDIQIQMVVLNFFNSCTAFMSDLSTFFSEQLKFSIILFTHLYHLL